MIEHQFFTKFWIGCWLFPSPRATLIAFSMSHTDGISKVIVINVSFDDAQNFANGCFHLLIKWECHCVH